MVSDRRKIRIFVVLITIGYLILIKSVADMQMCRIIFLRYMPKDCVFFPAGLHFLFNHMVFLNFRQISRKNVLNNDSRKRLYEAINQNPGVHFKALIQHTGINRGTASYHLNYLTKIGMIFVIKKGKKSRYFKNSNKFKSREWNLRLYLQEDTTRKILLLLLEEYKPSQCEISGFLGLSTPSVFWQMKQLINVGIVKSYREGQTVRYRIKTDYGNILKDITKHTDTEASVSYLL
ncbi:winged helix-turn-helix transcriptional regulator [Methanofollis formosanus]|uniref:Winged helix-turn-helix transcriptional regulator n=1 Tax=Methanofollis formosanus TaxID=299308 RepID=A0A8G1A0J3_9EURY|nr:winged helix-turn-helix transcriptional regulator [Methanofollis formosanus]QYZ78191.1 winged helix-turn-helix transcriptional regulator [Methanofollis formosanus]